MNKKELKEEYKEIKIYFGVYKVTCLVNNKIYVGSFTNLKNRWVTELMKLELGQHVNSELQNDFNLYNKDNFTYEVLEEIDQTKSKDIKGDLKALEELWLEQLQPYDDIGYNKRKKTFTE